MYPELERSVLGNMLTTKNKSVPYVACFVIAQAAKNLKVSRNRYSSGLTTNTEVLDAETLRIKSQYNHANARYDRLLAREIVDLEMLYVSIEIDLLT